MDLVTEFSTSLEIILNSAFGQFGALLIFFYGFLPQTFQLVSITGFIVRLLDTGFSPMVIILLGSGGILGGQFLLYTLGKYSYRLFKKQKKKLVSTEHIMHKYRSIIFFSPVWLGALGDLILILAGHQHTSFKKIAPYLFIGNLTKLGFGMLVLLAQLQTPEFLAKFLTTNG